MSRQLLIVGHGMAAQRLVEKLVAAGADWQITVIGEEPQPAYNRILLSPYLADEVAAEALPLASRDWYSEHNIRLHCGDPVTAIDRDNQTVVTAQGRHLPYDHLVLATGAEARIPELPGTHLSGVHVFRTRADADQLRNLRHSARNVLVVGGGFLGLEAADGLQQQGLNVRVLHRSGHLLNRQLDQRAGQLLQQALESRGIAVHCNAELRALEGETRISSITLRDGTAFPAEAVVFAAGIQPRMALAQATGLEVNQGICVDPQLRTSDPAIFAIGECAEADGETVGLVEPAYRQAELLARLLSGEQVQYRPEATAARLKISGLPLFSCGQIEPDRQTESLVYEDFDTGDYRHLLIRDNRLVGAVLYGDTRMGPWLFDRLQNRTDISPYRALLAFGEPYCNLAAA
ncbi:FAD-dependent oxidoreductase [Marinobacteraceae bacterium S3BR75-40.1]